MSDTSPPVPTDTPTRPPAGPVWPPRNGLVTPAVITAFLFWPAGLVLGIMALVQIKATGQRGKVDAILAIVVSSIGAAIAMVLVACVGVAAISTHASGDRQPPGRGDVAGSTTAEPSAEPTEDPDRDPSDVSSGGISWAEGATLSTGDAFPQWADSVVSDQDWELTSPDNGEGQWGYTSTSTGCTLTFIQTHADPAARTGNDREGTLHSLTTFLSTVGDYSPEKVEAAAQEQPMSYGTSGSTAGVDGLQVTARSGVIWARTFVKADVTLLLVGACDDPKDLPRVTKTIDSQAIIVF